MVISRSARIITLLVIDTVFFFVELISGYAVGSLALVADSFHMLNDVLSLVVALYTIKLATSPSSAKNSYGWQRAEILGALINGVFLVALCMSIFLEAIGRIVSPPHISNPKLIVIVGTLGLLSNIVGLFLFHEHGHSHGHSHGGDVQLPEDNTNTERRSDSARPRADSMSSLYAHPAQTRASVIETAHEFGYGRHTDETAEISDKFAGAMSPPSLHSRSLSINRRSSSRAQIRRESSATRIPPVPGSNSTKAPSRIPLIDGASSSASTTNTSTTIVPPPPGQPPKQLDDHVGHDHVHDHSEHAADLGQAEQGGQNGNGQSHNHSHGDHGHSHGSMNMRGVFLHVMGDALGNVGVIAAGLVIWFCHGKWTLYFDPGVSLLITIIIFHSAVPLVKSASYILMQGVPSHVSLDAVRESIYGVSGVVSVHELHVWQLSESTVVASVHVLIGTDESYMDVANDIRQALHSHGIHSVTIQPE
ncbi:solute carrier family 30 (zinc transporter), member 1 [Tremella mesenterica]|uniref:Solute carrier family 30 (Zinc transporter), member 1 n=1 Tax=Tremella mesenterica TaxID=5217 RepID=A0A4Q1BV88_TREME|nr:solute carrier family 30 (zinc transporter), member 1 [Tremella mesenterica]